MLAYCRQVDKHTAEKLLNSTDIIFCWDTDCICSSINRPTYYFKTEEKHEHLIEVSWSSGAGSKPMPSQYYLLQLSVLLTSSRF
jgi:hypothetical protein